MEKFISFTNIEDKISYLFNKNHYLLLLCSLIIIIFFSMYLSRQRHKIQKGSVIFIALLLLVFEGLRIFWRYKYLQANYQSLDFLNVTNLDFFTLSLWVSIPLIFFAALRKKKNKPASISLNFVFGVATLFAIITLVYPVNINTNFEFWHCYNLIYLLTRSLICMLGLMFVFAKWISVGRFLDVWKSLFALLFLGVACFVSAYFFAPQTNLFYINSFPIFDSIGIHLPFPWHILMLGAFLFVFQVILHIPFIIRQHIKNKRGL